jgi:hypothetical protein
MRRIFKQRNLLLLSARTPDELLSGAPFSCELAPAESYFLQKSSCFVWYTWQQIRWTPRSRLNQGSQFKKYFGVWKRVNENFSFNPNCNWIITLLHRCSFYSPKMQWYVFKIFVPAFVSHKNNAAPQHLKITIQGIVSDPHWLYADPDPAFYWMRIRIQVISKTNKNV